MQRRAFCKSAVAAGAIEPHMQGFYTNLHEDSERRTWGNYGENYPRLVAVKNRYDPGNLFRLNANVRPDVARGGSEETLTCDG